MNKQTDPQRVQPAIIKSSFILPNGGRITIYTGALGIKSFHCDENWNPIGKPFAECPMEWANKTPTEYHLYLRNEAHKPENFVPEQSTVIDWSAEEIVLPDPLDQLSEWIAVNFDKDIKQGELTVVVAIRLLTELLKRRSLIAGEETGEQEAWIIDTTTKDAQDYEYHLFKWSDEHEEHIQVAPLRKITMSNPSNSKGGEDLQMRIEAKYDTFFGTGYWEAQYKKHIVIFAKQCCQSFTTPQSVTPPQSLTKEDMLKSAAKLLQRAYDLNKDDMGFDVDVTEWLEQFQKQS